MMMDRFSEFKRHYETGGRHFIVLGGKGDTEFTGCGVTPLSAHLDAEAKIEAGTPDKEVK